jgi:DNA-binding transcriptional ArsR family regulator
MNLVSLGMAKVTYGALKILRRHLGQDLEVALIGFAVVMRTRRDLFEIVEQEGLNDRTISEITSERGFYTSVYEIHRFTGINRATVRRKMNQLREQGILEKVDDDKWHLVDFEHGATVKPAIMLRELLENYLVITSKLEALLPQEVVPVMKKSLSDIGGENVSALLDEDVEKKIKRGLEVSHNGN